MTRHAVAGSRSGAWFETVTARRVHHVKNGDWHGQALYQTAKGLWILESWSAVDGERDTYDLLSPTAAAVWLGENDGEDEALNIELEANQL